MKSIANVTTINEFYAQNGEITAEKWIELAKEAFSQQFKNDCQHIINVFTEASKKKDRHAYAMAFGHYRSWIDQNRSSIMGCMKRDCKNFAKFFGIELDTSVGRGMRLDWTRNYIEQVVNPVLSYDDMSRKLVNAYNTLILPMANDWARATAIEKQKLCGEL